MEELQADPLGVGQGGQRGGGAVELPAGRQVTAVLAGVGIADHHLLARIGAQQRRHGRGLQIGGQHLGRGPQVGDGFEERLHTQGRRRSARIEEADLLHQDVGLQQVGHRTGVGDYVGAKRLGAEPGPRVGGGLEDGVLAQGLFGIAAERGEQGTPMRQLLQEEPLAAGLVEGEVIAAGPRLGQELGHHPFVHRGVLAKVEAGQVEAEHTYRADQVWQRPVGEGLGVRLQKRRLQDLQIGDQLVRRGVGPGCGGRRPGRRAAGERLEGGREPGVHGGQRAAVGLSGAGGMDVPEALGQGGQLRRRRGEVLRQRKADAQPADLLEVVAEHGLGLAGQRAQQHLAGDVGVAVAVAADPAAQAQEARQPGPEPPLPSLVELRHGREQARAHHRDGVLDLVQGRRPGASQQPRAPKQRDFAQQGFRQPGLPGSAVRTRQRLQRLAQDAGVFEDAAAAHLARVGGEYRNDKALLEQGAHLILVDSGLGEASQHVVEAHGVLAQARAPHLHRVLGRVGRLEEAGEAVHDLEGFVGAQTVEQRRQLPGRTLEMAGHGEPTHRFDAREGGRVLLANDLTEQRPHLLGGRSNVSRRGCAHGP